MEADIWGLWAAGDGLSLLVSCNPPGRLPMVDGGGLEEGEGDLGGDEDRGGASTGGSSTTDVLCEGVWLLEDTWVTVGDTAVGRVSTGASASYRAHRCGL